MKTENHVIENQIFDEYRKRQRKIKEAILLLSILKKDGYKFDKKK
tara:strand:- start:1972 stop:2106 length:135 start_codon:yes stop_codon:yes gene_type:complete